MSEKLLVPSIEKRMSALVELARRNFTDNSLAKESGPPTITISREFGCEGFPVAEKLKALFEEKTGKTWGIMDRELLAEAAKNHNLSEEIFKTLGERHRFLDDMLSTFSSRWQSERDYFKLLTKQVVALATAGNVIIVGRGSSIVTQKMPNCFHFRIVAPSDFKVKAIARRMNISPDEAVEVVRKRQKMRDAFINDFLGKDVTDPTWYHLIFNNGKNTPERIASTIFRYVAG